MGERSCREGAAGSLPRQAERMRHVLFWAGAADCVAGMHWCWRGTRMALPDCAAGNAACACILTLLNTCCLSTANMSMLPVLSGHELERWQL